ncbi:MAG: hypothetical protein AB7F59_07675 [Bdellovibrionales bacterium]
MSRKSSLFYLFLTAAVIMVVYQNCGPARIMDTPDKQNIQQTNARVVSIEGNYTAQLDGCGPIVCRNNPVSDGWTLCFKLLELSTTPTEGQKIHVDGVAVKAAPPSDMASACMSDMDLLKVNAWQPL